jgi:hypothetical protein
MYVAASGKSLLGRRWGVGETGGGGGHDRRTAAAPPPLARLAKATQGAEQIGLAGGTPADGSCSAGKKLSLLHLLPHSSLSELLAVLRPRPGSALAASTPSECSVCVILH